jgi:hypothetical protein
MQKAAPRNSRARDSYGTGVAMKTLLPVGVAFIMLFICDTAHALAEEGCDPTFCGMITSEDLCQLIADVPQLRPGYTFCQNNTAYFCRCKVQDGMCLNETTRDDCSPYGVCELWEDPFGLSVTAMCTRAQCQESSDCQPSSYCKNDVLYRPICLVRECRANPTGPCPEY